MFCHRGRVARRSQSRYRPRGEQLRRGGARRLSAAGGGSPKPQNVDPPPPRCRCRRKLAVPRTSPCPRRRPASAPAPGRGGGGGRRLRRTEGGAQAVRRGVANKRHRLRQEPLFPVLPFSFACAWLIAARNFIASFSVSPISDRSFDVDSTTKFFPSRKLEHMIPTLWMAKNNLPA